MKPIYLLLLLLIIGLSACSKDDEQDGDLQTLQGTIVWTGPIATDGCGFILYNSDGSERHSPTNDSNIPDSYKTGDNIPVTVKMINYKKPVLPCININSFNQVKIIEIKRR